MNIPTDQTYKNIDNVNRFLGNIWYLIGYVSENSDIEQSLELIDEDVLQPLIERSEEFCLDIYHRIMLSEQLLGSGGFGLVAYLYVTENGENRRIYAVNVSLKQSRGFTYNYIPVVGKFSRKAYLFEPDLALYRETLWLEWSDPLQEIFVGGLSSFLFDVGINPHATKYFGAYFCHESTGEEEDSLGDYKLHSNIILEESSFTIFHMLERSEDILSQITFNDLLTLIFQYLYSVYTFKYYFGYVNFDAHLGNLMVSYIRTDKISLPYPKLPFKYNGKDLDTVDYLVYTLPLDNPVEIWVENSGLILKLIDFGLTSVNLTQSPSPFNYNFGVKSNVKMFETVEKAMQAWNHYLNDPEVGNTIDVNFTLVNLWAYLILGFDKIKAKGEWADRFDNNQHLHHTLISQLDELVHLLVPSMDQLLTQYRKDQPVFRDKDVGTNAPRNHFLERIIEYLSSKGQMDREIYWITRDGNPPKNNNAIHIDPLKIANFSEMKRFFVSVNSFYTKGCDPFTETEKCEKLSQRVAKSSPDINTERSLIENVVEGNRLTVSKNHEIWRSGTAQIYTFNIYAGQNPQNKLDLTFHQYQRLFDFKEIPSKLVDQIYPNTVLHMIKVDTQSTNRPEIYVDLGITDLYTIADFFFDEHQGFVVSGGFFVVPYNVNSPLSKLSKELYPQAHQLTREDVNYPIGYYYNRDTPDIRGTRLPIPKPYRKYFAMVKIKNNKISLEKYQSFIARHLTEDWPITYNLYDQHRDEFKTDNGEPEKYVVLQKVIKLVDNEPQILSGKLDYDVVFTAGPILIWDKKVIFTEKMLAERFQIELPSDNPALPNTEPAQPMQGYRVVVEATNTNMFYSGSGERIFPYGQRPSANINVLNVLSIFDNGDIAFFLVEGRGFGAVGMDRIQIAKLISSQFPKVKHAVGLDGGFSANCVYGTKGDLRYLLPDPEKRPLGTVMTFITR